MTVGVAPPWRDQIRERETFRRAKTDTGPCERVPRPRRAGRRAGESKDENSGYAAGRHRRCDAVGVLLDRLSGTVPPRSGLGAPAAGGGSPRPYLHRVYDASGNLSSVDNVSVGPDRPGTSRRRGQVRVEAASMHGRWPLRIAGLAALFGVLARPWPAGATEARR